MGVRECGSSWWTFHQSGGESEQCVLDFLVGVYGPCLLSPHTTAHRTLTHQHHSTRVSHTHMHACMYTGQEAAWWAAAAQDEGAIRPHRRKYEVEWGVSGSWCCSVTPCVGTECYLPP